ncbi:calcium-transporting ATPase [Rhodotorula paludigena]|uniref:calcium-transporting ATPase n=1 Tax=Rhodotorula paludigena TaxID=86838 RepID=UPI00316EF41E
MPAPHTQTADELSAAFHVDLKRGLSAAQVAEQERKHGKNVLPEEPSPPLWQLILEQFKDQLVLILLASAGISLVLAYLEEGEDKATAYVEPIVILAILIANAWVGVVQETNAEKAIEALMEYSPDEAKVMRDGRTKKIHAVDLVPGDIISLAVGDKVPADSRIISISSASFTVDQALLTGESYSVTKQTDVVPDEKAVKQDMTNMLFSGTTVVTGKALAVVVATGSQTAIGNIHTSITSQISEKTPLKQKVDDFGEQLAKVIAVICILVWVVNFRNFNDPSHGGLVKGAIYYFKIAVALAVAAIPEGLPAVITTCLALGTKKMARKNAIVRSLPSVETLGSTNVICSDKTGTLTTNQMSIARFALVEDGTLEEFTIEGATYAPVGDIRASDGSKVSPQALTRPTVSRFAQIASLCNDAKIGYSEETDTYASVGEPTEAALRVLVEKIGGQADDGKLAALPALTRYNAVNTDIEARFSRVLTFEFSRDRKSMSVLVRENSATTSALYVKGAPESILERCDYVGVDKQPLTAELRAEITKTVRNYGSQGLRTLALAYVDNVDPDASHYRTDSAAKYADFEQKMVFAGLVGMLDPPRPEVRGAIAKCKTAGVRVVVITGDNKLTAETICRQIGVFGEDEDLTGKSFTGKEFSELSDTDKLEAVLNANLFSRTEPNHKLEIVELLQAQGLVCAMTGDGVNDSPALRRAAIGIAMGSGTDVAKLASDMVLADDNFATIELAIEEGRSIYENTKQFIRYLISSNIGEVVSIFLTVLLGMPEALLSVQLLWVNLVTDGLPATALGFNPPDHSIMRRPPRSSKEPLISGWLFFRYLVIGIYVGGATVFDAWWFLFYEGGPKISWYQLTHFHKCSEYFPSIGCGMFHDEMAKRATTVSLSILVVIEMFNALNSLAENESLLTLPPWRNMYLVGAITLSMALHFMILYVPFFSTLFQITPLNLEEWKAVVLISFPVIVIDEILKFVSNTFVAPPAKLKQE